MLKNDWTKKLIKLSLSKGVDYEKMEITPFRDWRIVAVVFFVGIVLSIGFNAYVSIAINRDNFLTAVPKGGDGVIFNNEGLVKVLAGFAEREALFEKARTEKSAVVDPSL